ncbi:MAG: L-aspartate oxidase [Candidatus Cloacimonetes bacterium]|nr:L-aspartate oxidase [Candidatus Cloacimonadota bacterium]
MNENDIVKTDFLVIGSGIAGLQFAIEVSKIGKVVIVTKQKIFDSNTELAQGGIAAAIDETDSFESHIEDTYKASVGLGHKSVIEEIVSSAPNIIENMIQMGVKFNTKNGKKISISNLALAKEGGHSRKRIIYVEDFTGREIEQQMIEIVRKNPNIKIYENHMTVDLITQHHIKGNGQFLPGITCWGAYVLDIQNGKVKRFLANKTLLATGGCGQIYYYTTNSETATGDGIAMAYRAGARIANMEFIQFHPTTLYQPDSQRAFLISEAVRGEGAILRLPDHSEFMKEYHPMENLAPRDVVSQAIDFEMVKNGYKFVYLDLTHLNPEKMIARFPQIYKKCIENGFDFTKDMIPVVPAAHYSCGGILSNTDGETDIKNLYACGETACIGLHGANRLASNSLLEGAVTSNNAAKLPQNIDKIKFPNIPKWSEENIFDENEWVVISHNKSTLREMMWNYVGIIRSNRRLQYASERIRIFYREIEEFYQKNPVRRDLIEARNLATTAYLIIRSAIMRKESRGLHFNRNYPEKKKEFERDTII